MSTMLDMDTHVISINTDAYPNFEVIKNWSVPILVYYFERNHAKGALVAALLCAKALSMK